MSVNFISKATVVIDAPAAKVWQALTSPDVIREYMFGTRVETDWKIGSSIYWRGQHQGQEYEDKGTILQVLPEKLLQHTYHSSMSGIEDQPENYFNLIYELEEVDNQTTVTLTTSNLPDENSVQHIEQNWKEVLMKLKEVVERQPEKIS